MNRNPIDEVGLLMVIGLVVVIVLFFVFRELLNWYWKINERVAMQAKTNQLLEKISMQLDALIKKDEVTVEKISTGMVKTMKMEEWIMFKNNNPNLVDYRVIKGVNDLANPF